MISLGICAYNEEQNIGYLLNKVCQSTLIDEVIVVASGCTDRTVDIASNFGVKVLIQEKREGKSSAVNLFLKEAQGDLLILEGADTLPSGFCYKYLLSPFQDKSIGIVGGHTIPLNSLRTTLGKMGLILWESHHRMSLHYPKAGEIIAFRHIVEKIPVESLVDEASLEYEITSLGYQVAYSPMAIVFNRSPETYSDFLKQRRRIYSGHKWLAKLGYKVPSMDAKVVVKSVLDGRVDLLPLVMAGSLELWARITATETNPIWEPINTTKGVYADKGITT